MDSSYVQLSTSSSFITRNELNLITVGFSKNFAKPPYSVDLYIRNINKNLFSSSSNIMTGQNISDSFFLSSWKMVGCASREGGVYVNKASNIIFSDVKLVCGFNSAPIASSSVSANDISSSGTTANCQLGVYTTVNHYHCLVCDEGYYDTIYDGCQASCSAPSFAMTTSRTCSPYCASSVVPAGSRYCYYGCMSACSENCVSCTGNICNVCTGCGNGYYLENATYTCQPCNSTCQNCTSDQECTICKPNFNLADGKCDNCNDGYYRDGDTCNPCNITCKLCNSLTSCTECQPNFNLIAEKCEVCINGYYRTGNTCDPCNITCKLCNSLTSCTECQPNFNLTNEKCDFCNNGYYRDGNTCKPCNPTCALCNSETSCTTCKPNFNLIAEKCEVCINGYYRTGNTCDQCEPTCAVCSSLTSCTECQPNFNLTNGKCENCNQGFYLSGPAVCSPCGANCMECTSSECTKCNSGYNLTSGSCENCLDGYYLSPTGNGSCLPCKATCTLCSSLTSCTACQTNFLLQNEQCDSCLPGYYRSEDSCLSCSQPCVECSTSATYCTACDSPFKANNGDCSSCTMGLFVTNSSGNFCEEACPEGYTPDQSSTSCIILHTNNSNISNPIAASFVENAQSVSNTLSGAGTATSVAIAASSTASGSFSTTLMLCFVAKEAIVNMQYLNIGHSETAFTYYRRMQQSFVPSWFYQLETENSSQVIYTWGSFERNSVSALYLDNNGDTLSENLIYIGLALLTMIPTLCLRKESRVGAFSTKLYLTFLNVAISNVIGKLQSEVLFFILQVKDHFFFDGYTKLSLVVGYTSTIMTTGALVFWGFQLQNIYAHKTRTKNYPRNVRKKMIQQETWRSEKYQVLWSDFKEDSKNRFFFMYWIVLFNVGYILLIFSVQSAPIAQCSLIIAWTILFMIFSAMIRPFKTFSSNFSHYFNLGSIVVVGALNLYLSIMENDPTFTSVEQQGLVIVIMIIINIAVNMLASLIGMTYNIYLYIKNYKRIKAERMKKKLKLQRLGGSRLRNHRGPDMSGFELFNESPTSKKPIRSDYYEDNSEQNLLSYQQRERQQLNFVLEPSKDSMKKRKTVAFNQETPTQSAVQPRRSTREKKDMGKSRSELEEPLPKIQGLMENLEKEINYSKPDGNPRRPTILVKTDNARRQTFIEPVDNQRRQTIKEIVDVPRRQTLQETTGNARRETITGHVDRHTIKVISMAAPQGQQNIPINFEWKLDDQMKVETEDTLAEKPPTYAYRKLSQPADSDNPFIRIEARRKARTLEPGFLMK